MIFSQVFSTTRPICPSRRFIQGHVNLLSKRVRFSCLLQQNVMWRLPEWSALWSR